MRINTRFSVAVHVLALMALNTEAPAASEKMALSVGGHPVAIRQVMSALHKAGLIETQAGVPGGRLAKPQEEITLWEVYRAVRQKEDASLFDLHPSPNPLCPVGRNIREALEDPLADAQTAMEDALGRWTLRDITTRIVERVMAERDAASSAPGAEPTGA